MGIYQIFFVFILGLPSIDVRFNERAAQKLKLINDSSAPSFALGVAPHFVCVSVNRVQHSRNCPDSAIGKYCLNYVKDRMPKPERRQKNYTCHLKYYYYRIEFESICERFSSFAAAEECHRLVPYLEHDHAWSRGALGIHNFMFSSSFSLFVSSCHGTLYVGVDVIDFAFSNNQ